MESNANMGWIQLYPLGCLLSWKHSYGAYACIIVTRIACSTFVWSILLNILNFLLDLLGNKTPKRNANWDWIDIASRTEDEIKCIFYLLHSQNDLSANHPKSNIYNTFNSLVEFDGYYFKSEPCVACSCTQEWSWTTENWDEVLTIKL